MCVQAWAEPAAVNDMLKAHPTQLHLCDFL